jgi:translation initiation factor IF-2
MPISVNDLAKKLDIAPEAVVLHAMDLDFDIPEDDMVPDELAKEITNIELGDEISQTTHDIEEQLEREVKAAQQAKTIGSKKKIAKKKEKEKKQLSEREEVEIKTDDSGVVILPEEMTVRELAVKISKPIPIVLVKMKQNGIIANLKENVDYEVAAIIAEELGIKVRKETTELTSEELFKGDLKTLLKDEDPELLKKRPPVVSIMGHVDHGKTSILDYIRSAKVVDGEAGGITQRIGAYQVKVKDELVTFLDTPGHAAFTLMRARGAHATDIAILVVAANEGMKPQTVEAINHAKAANIPMIVAINKMDLDGANPDRIKKELMDNEITPEEWGGETPCVPVSAKTGEGIDKLLETILVVAEMQELKATPDRTAICTVLEASMDKFNGITATVLVNTGTLQQGDAYVIFDKYGKIRSMTNHLGKRVKNAPPSSAIQLSGFTELPQSGDLLQAVKTEKIARKRAEEVASINHTDELSKKKKPSLATLKAKIAEGRLEQLLVVLKCDQQGTLEAVRSEITKIRTEKTMVKVIHSGVGEVSESDVMLASAGTAVVVGFSIAAAGRIKKLADREGVELMNFDVIYHLSEKLTEIIEGREQEEEGEKVVGEFKIKAVFASNKKMAVIGGEMISGLALQKLRFNIYSSEEKSEETLVGQGKVDTLQLGQKVVGQVNEGVECGMKIDHKELTFEPGYILEFVQMTGKK